MRRIATALVAAFAMSCVAPQVAENGATPAPTPSRPPAEPASAPSTPSQPTSIGSWPDAPPASVRPIAGMSFAMIDGPADLRIETALPPTEAFAIRTLLTTDIEAVEREFARSFTDRPLVYVFATTDSYAAGLERIFGYPSVTAAFVAQNSVSFFEPSLLAIAVNWQAVAGRRPISAIRHELTHRITLDACAPRCDLVPAWLNEGQARLAEAFVGEGGWRHTRVRYEAASMAASNTLIPLSSLVSQLSWNSITDWAGYYKYQEAARATELLREDVSGSAPIARIYERLRRGENLATAYQALTGRSFNDFVASLPSRMRDGVPPGPGVVTLADDRDQPAPSYLLYGFGPSTRVTLTVSGPRGTESWPLAVSPFGALFDSLPPTRASGGYTLSIQHPGGVLTTSIHKLSAGRPGDSR